MSTPALEGKRVVITAAAAGLGRVVAQRFVEVGARVYGCDIAGVDQGGLPNDFTLRNADASGPAAVDRFFDEAVAGLGGLDVLINNAGIAGPVGPVEEISVEGWRRTMAVNIDGHFYFARRAMPLMKEQGGGSIINISSTRDRSAIR